MSRSMHRIFDAHDGEIARFDGRLLQELFELEREVLRLEAAAAALVRAAAAYRRMLLLTVPTLMVVVAVSIALLAGAA